MKCNEVREKAFLEDWDNRDRSPDLDFEKHLKECKDCAEFVEKTRKAASALSQTKRIPVPQDLWQGIRLKIQEEACPPHEEKIHFLDLTLNYLRFVNPKWAMAIAAGFILVISLTGLPFKMNRMPSSYENISVLLQDSEEEEWTEDFGSDIETYFL